MTLSVAQREDSLKRYTTCNCEQWVGFFYGKFLTHRLVLKSREHTAALHIFYIYIFISALIDFYEHDYK